MPDGFSEWLKNISLLGPIKPPDYEAWRNFRERGGEEDYTTWIRMGRPTKPEIAGLAPRLRRAPTPALEREAPPGTRRPAALPAAPPTEEVPIWARPPEPTTPPTEPPPEGREWAWDASNQRWVARLKAPEVPAQTPQQRSLLEEEQRQFNISQQFKRDQLQLSERQLAQADRAFKEEQLARAEKYGLSREQLAQAQEQFEATLGLRERELEVAKEPVTYERYGEDPYGGGGQFNPYTGRWEPGAGYIDPYQAQTLALERQQMEMGGRQFEAQQEATAALQQQVIDWQRQQQQMALGAEREARAAALKARPASWLEYAAYTGEAPAVQPWMVPLGTEGQFQVGQPIPGWGAEAPGMGLPELTRPGGQYLTRMGPTAREQFGAYRQARTGAPPEETAWRQWMAAPPGGGFPGARRTR